MGVQLGVVMDPIESIKPKKDSTLAILLEAQARGWSIHYMEQSHLSLRDGRAEGDMAPLNVKDDARQWFTVGQPRRRPLDGLDVILMRVDPPIDMEYIYATHILERAEEHGVLVVNKPQSLRDANEKLYTAWFSQCTPPTLVSRDGSHLSAFLDEQQDIILKPLAAMGGTSIFRVRRDDPNVNVILETLTHNGCAYTMAQRYLPEIKNGDKRILLIDGEPVPYALARFAKPGETRANLAVGGRGEGIPLSERDLEICHQTGPALRDKGLLFVGLDVIGDYLTEINVTSPTCIRELDAQFGLNISATLLDAIEARL
jgi:glutathione synthase